MDCKKEIYYQGEDIKLKLSILNELGELVDIDNLKDLIVYIYLVRNQYIKFTRSDMVRVNEFEYDFIITSQTTNTLYPGDYMCELNVVYPDDILTDERFNSIDRSYIFTILNSSIGRES